MDTVTSIPKHFVTDTTTDASAVIYIVGTIANAKLRVSGAYGDKTDPVGVQ